MKVAAVVRSLADGCIPLDLAFFALGLGKVPLIFLYQGSLVGERNISSLVKLTRREKSGRNRVYKISPMI